MKNKPTLIVIVLLLIVFVPATIYGTILKLKKEDEPKVLEYAKSTLADEDKIANIFTHGVKENIDNFSANGREYAFITENDKVYLYSLKDQNKVLDYDAINFYSTDIANNYILVKREGKWGVMNLNTIKMVIPCEYDYLGLINNFKDGKLVSDAYIVGNNKSYSIYALKEDEFAKVSNNFSLPIHDFNINQILLSVKDKNNYLIYDFGGNRFYSDYSIKDVIITDNMVSFIDQNNKLYVFGGLFTEPKETVDVKPYKTFFAKEVNKELEIYFDDVLYKKIDI